jgi:translocation protein SEC72
MAAHICVQRPPFEAPQVMREELSVVLSNRAAAHIGNEDYISSLADAETVIQIRKNWPKGYFRKAKALLGLKSYGEAIEAVHIGLSYEPENSVNFLDFLSALRSDLTTRRN